MSKDDHNLDTLIRDHAETVRRVTDIEEWKCDMSKEINEVKIDLNSLKIKLGLYAAIGATVGGAFITGIVALVLSLLHK